MQRGSDGRSELHGGPISFDEGEADIFAPLDQGDFVRRRRLIRHFGPDRNVHVRVFFKLSAEKWIRTRLSWDGQGGLSWDGRGSLGTTDGALEGLGSGLRQTQIQKQRDKN